MSVFMPVIEQVTSWVSCNANEGSLPWPINHISQGITLAHIGTFATKENSISLPKLALNHVISQQAIIPELARAILIARKTLAVFQQASIVKKINTYLSTVASGSFPTPVRLLRESATIQQLPFGELLLMAPAAVSSFALTLHQSAQEIERLFHASMTCLWKCIELLFSLWHDKITRFEANTQIATNFQEICGELEKDPEKLSREIEANAETIDAILPWIHPEWTTKNLSAALTKGVKTALDVNNKTKTLFDMGKELLQQSVFIISSIATNTNVAPLGVGTVPSDFAKGSMDHYYELVKRKQSKQNQRYFV